MRHGEPDVPALADRVSSKEFLTCLELYKSCGILDTDKPPDSAQEMFSHFKAIVSSDLKRSIDSASLLSSGTLLTIDPMFREIEDTFIQIPYLKLTPKSWSIIFILLWFVGALDFKKAFKKGKLRAKNCAGKLVGLAEEHEKVLFVGHGFINTYIAKELKLLGWDGPKSPSKRYWGYSVYHKNTA